MRRDEVCDLLFPVRGDCVRAGYGYQLFSAIKSALPHIAKSWRWRLGSVEGVRGLGGGILKLTAHSRLRIRVAVPYVRELLDLKDATLRVGAHIISLKAPEIALLSPASELWCDAFYCTSDKPGRDRGGKGHGDPYGRIAVGYLYDRLERDFGCTPEVTVGRRRLLDIRRSLGHYHIGFAIGLRGLEEEASMELQRYGLGSERDDDGCMRGARSHMGAQMWLPGTLPGWCQDTRQRG